MRERIRVAALQLFDRYGFHNTGIRDIAAEASCSLPTLYYHYQNKERLFERIVCDAFEQLSRSIDDQVPEGLPLKETFYYIVMQRRMLSPSEKLVFRLAVKVQMGIDGTEETQKRIKKWVDDYNGLNYERLISDFEDVVFARLALRVLGHMLQNTLFEEDSLSDDDIRRELDMLFSIKGERGV